jgi:hypothetical protein
MPLVRRTVRPSTTTDGVSEVRQQRRGLGEVGQKKVSTEAVL